MLGLRPSQPFTQQTTGDRRHSAGPGGLIPMARFPFPRNDHRCRLECNDPVVILASKFPASSFLASSIYITISRGMSCPVGYRRGSSITYECRNAEYDRALVPTQHRACEAACELRSMLKSRPSSARDSVLGGLLKDTNIRTTEMRAAHRNLEYGLGLPSPRRPTSHR